MPCSDKQKVHLTLRAETVGWLEDQYKDADSTPEAVRAFINDSRRFWDMVNVEINEK